METKLVTKEVLCTDAIGWLHQHQPLAGTSLLASLPDISEFSCPLNEWQQWFIETARLIMEKTPPGGVSIFFQSDIKIKNTWVDKSYLCLKAQELAGQNLLWHKIVCRAPADTPALGRPLYSHLLCFTSDPTLIKPYPLPDVFSSTGEKSWARGMGLTISEIVAKFIKEATETHTLINPFCGEGSMLAAANHVGLNALGIEKNKKRALKAQGLIIDPIKKNWGYSEKRV